MREAADTIHHAAANGFRVAADSYVRGRQKLEDRVRHFISSEPALRSGEIMTVPYETAVYHTEK